MLNGVSYCRPFLPTTTTLNVSGLAGGRKYEMKLELTSTNTMFLNQESKMLEIDVDPMCAGGEKGGRLGGGEEGVRRVWGMGLSG